MRRICIEKRAGPVGDILGATGRVASEMYVTSLSLAALAGITSGYIASRLIGPPKQVSSMYRDEYLLREIEARRDEIRRKRELGLFGAPMEDPSSDSKRDIVLG